MKNEIDSQGWSRRRFVRTAVAAGSLLSLNLGCRQTKGPTRPKTVAILSTIIRKLAHAQHFVDRFIDGYGWQGRHHKPSIKLASLYFDQFPEGDLSRDRSQRGGVPIYPTIEETLTCGGSKLAVDGVLIIGEHGQYPKNEMGQTLYPRYAWFKKIVSVFKESGRSVPVFNDKHLSVTWPECEEMVADSRELDFPFMAGSSLPVTWRIPAIDMPVGTPLRESVCVCYGGVDSYDFHGLETAQCMAERRRGGEVGVKSVQGLRGERVWEALRAREITRQLLLAALARSHTLRGPDGYAYGAPDLARLSDSNSTAVAYFIEHLDGHHTTMFMLNGIVNDFTYAGMTDAGKIVSCQMHLPMPPRYTTLANFFNPLVNHIEQMIHTRRTPYPIERTLLTSGMTLFGVQSLHQNGSRIETPQMAVAYQPGRRSTYWRA